LRAPQALIDDFIELMSEDTEIANPGELPRVNIKDKDDLPILSAAIAAKTTIFVTGEKDILDVRQIQQMAITSPRQFWEVLKNPPSQRSRRSH